MLRLSNLFDFAIKTPEAFKVFSDRYEPDPLMCDEEPGMLKFIIVQSDSMVEVDFLASSSVLDAPLSAKAKPRLVLFSDLPQGTQFHS